MLSLIDSSLNAKFFFLVDLPQHDFIFYVLVYNTKQLPLILMKYSSKVVN